VTCRRGKTPTTEKKREQRRRKGGKTKPLLFRYQYHGTGIHLGGARNNQGLGLFWREHHRAGRENKEEASVKYSLWFDRSTGGVNRTCRKEEGVKELGRLQGQEAMKQYQERPMAAGGGGNRHRSTWVFFGPEGGTETQLWGSRSV